MELRISFAEDEPQFATIVVDGNELERVTSAKLLGLTVSSNLTWNEHVSDVIKKASKSPYLLKQLKRSRVSQQDMFLRTQHPSFSVRVESGQCMSIIRPGLPYQEAIELIYCTQF